MTEKKDKVSLDEILAEESAATLSFSRAEKQDSEILNIDEINKLLNLSEDKTIDRYKHVKTIGLGGVGAVLSAYEPELNREVAIKILRPAFRGKADALKRFVREARATAHIEHPNVVPVHQLGVFSDNGVFFSMKKVDGRDLRSVIRKLSEGKKEFLEKYTLRHLLQVFVSICNGVAYAHSKGIIHRDLKPGNIMLGDYGEVMVMDWGLVKYHAEKDSSDHEWEVDFDPDFNLVGHNDIMNTIQGSVSGTPAYMAPEQAGGRNADIDEKTDQYSLGAILYSILTWETAPFESPMTTNQVLNCVVNGDFKKPRKRAPKRKISRELEAICLKAMSLEREDRYDSVNDMVKDIRNYLEGYAVSAYRGSLARRFFKIVRRRPLIPSAAVVAFFTFMGVVGMLHYEKQARLENVKSFARYSIEQGNNFYLKAIRVFQKLEDEYKKTEDELSYSEINKLSGEFNRYKLEFNSNYTVATQFLFQAEDMGGKNELINKRLLDVLKQQLNFSLLTGDYQETKSLVTQLRLRRHRVFSEIISSDQEVYDQIKMIIRNEGILKVDSIPEGIKVFYEILNDDENMDKNRILMGTTPFSKKVPVKNYLLFLNTANGDIKCPVEVTCAQLNTVKIDIPDKIPDDMCYIPAGQFCFGTKKSMNKMDKTFLPAYFISRYEVTFGEYLKFWKSLKDHKLKKRYQARYLFSNGDFKYVDVWDNEGRLIEGFKEDMPVVGITGEAAKAYCKWLGEKHGAYFRLPTNLEWEKAARGVDGRIFSWGNSHKPNAALCWNNEAGRKKYPIAAPVGSFPEDKSIYGVMDLVGNVHEFTTEKMLHSNVFVIKGGSVLSRLSFSNCGYSTHSSGESENDIGFRYVMPNSKK